MSGFFGNSGRNCSAYNYAFIYFGGADEDAGWNPGLPDTGGNWILKRGSILY